MSFAALSHVPEGAADLLWAIFPPQITALTASELAASSSLSKKPTRWDLRRRCSSKLSHQNAIHCGNKQRQPPHALLYYTVVMMLVSPKVVCVDRGVGKEKLLGGGTKGVFS